ncbi:alpha/beta hydrolase [Sulfitobacter donghicola]|uniref:Uncharacterized protein n=1 Tax=Sulfitobacter donghicola DSW-25 = KCTC 12864 = JCM 14565 TaxID=1300350 RepID=A0A073IKM0_9RHOB|nr:alpha/beta hydrolase [Sulfitobacter donghicola]KEJ90021.1 hypothetical protein DSW25_07355 [Sulfitobacter donghicola DSW-25 = KCTC 12864 = JCM 14565]KIN66848.1 Abhydrolase 6 domain containing protein [Sulfitobacter donghicola DSW-25 = KCTC 12864 = JCM 14565]
MPLLRINATAQGLALHGSVQSAKAVLSRAANGQGPVVIMVHGFKYSPFDENHCPHERIFHADHWPHALDLAQENTLGIAFGWNGRGGLRHAYCTAHEQAGQLAQLIKTFTGNRPVHLIAHSLGATLVLAALPYLHDGDVGRIVLLSGAAHLGLAHHALRTPAGKTCELFHVTSRENALFDHAFEHMIPDTGAIGRGLDLPQAISVRIDCPRTLGMLETLGYQLAPPQRRICHWSSYTRPGVMALNAALLSGALPLHFLKEAVPPRPCLGDRANSLVSLQNSRIIAWYRKAKEQPHEHAY